MLTDTWLHSLVAVRQPRSALATNCRCVCKEANIPIQRRTAESMDDGALRDYLRESHRLVAAKLTRRLRDALGLPLGGVGIVELHRHAEGEEDGGGEVGDLHSAGHAPSVTRGQLTSSGRGWQFVGAYRESSPTRPWR